jgi:hypothetical protein
MLDGGYGSTLAGSETERRLIVVNTSLHSHPFIISHIPFYLFITVIDCLHMTP